MTRPRPRFRCALWLALAAMCLLSVGPLATQLSRLNHPAWLSELACASSSDPVKHLHDAPWAQCGYCTLLLCSPAATSAPVWLALVVLAGAAPCVLLRSWRRVPPVFPGALSRAPPR